MARLEVPREWVTLQVFSVWCSCHSTAVNQVQGGGEWWEMARGEAVEWLSHRCGAASPNSFSLHQPSRVSPAGVHVQQPLQDPPQVLCTAGELGQLLLLCSQLLCFAAASHGGRIRTEARRGNELPACSECAGSKRDILRGRAGQGQPACGWEAPALVCFISAEAFMLLSSGTVPGEAPARLCPWVPCRARPGQPVCGPWTGRRSRAWSGVVGLGRAEMNSASQETAGTHPTGCFSRCTLSTHSFSRPWTPPASPGHPPREDCDAQGFENLMPVEGTRCPRAWDPTAHGANGAVESCRSSPAHAAAHSAALPRRHLQQAFSGSLHPKAT